MNTTIYNTRKPVRMVFAAVAMFATLATAAQADLNVNTAAGEKALVEAGVAKLTAQYDAKTGIHQNRIELAAR